MKQILFTRFNVPTNRWQKTKYKNNVLDNKWMDHRIKLFEYLCLPSVINQTNNNFIWYIFFDKKTNDFYIEKVNNLIKNKNLIKIKFVDDMNDFLLKLLKICNNSNENILLTTRIDNDDMINVKYMEIVKNIAIEIINKNSKNTVIDFPHGCKINTTHIQYLNKNSNHFMSFISHKIDGKLFDIFNLGDHSKIYSFKNDYKDYCILNNKSDIVMWAEISHKYNLRNHLNDKQGSLYDLSFICDNFGILKENWHNFCNLDCN